MAAAVSFVISLNGIYVKVVILFCFRGLNGLHLQLSCRGRVHNLKKKELKWDQADKCESSQPRESLHPSGTTIFDLCVLELDECD